MPNSVPCEPWRASGKVEFHATGDSSSLEKGNAFTCSVAIDSCSFIS